MTHSISDWNSIDPGNRILSHDSQSLQFKTEGQGHFDLHFGNINRFGFQCNLNNETKDYKYYLHYPCSQKNSCCDMKDVPISLVRIWTFTLTTSWMYIYCRSGGEGEEANVEVMRVSYLTVSHCLTEPEWPSLLSDVEVYSDDIVTKKYRVISGKTLVLLFKKHPSLETTYQGKD